MVKRSSEAAVRAAAQTAAAQINGHEPDMPSEVVLENGVILKFKPFPAELVRRAAQRLAVPEVPRVMNEDKGREEDNPNDPKYLQAVAEHTQESWSTGVNVMIALGTEVSHVPDGLYRPEDEAWIADCKYFGVEVEAEDDRARYISWVQLYAVSGGGDWMKVLLPLIKRAGLTEEEVAQAVQSFRSGKVRGADNAVPGEASRDGSDVQASN